MTHAPKPDDRPEAKSPQGFWQAFLRRTGLSISVLTAAGLAGGAWWTWLYIHEQLAPQVAESLGELLSREVEIGAVQQVSLAHIEFGPSAVPATDTDPDSLATESVLVRFNLLDLLWDRTLDLDITLHQVQAYVEQDPDRRWITTELKSREREGFIKTEVDRIQVRQGQLIAVPYLESGESDRAPISVESLNGELTLHQENQRIAFAVQGQAYEQGRIEVAGEFFRPLEALKLSIQGQNLPAVDISRIVQLPAPQFQAGLVDGSLMLSRQRGQSLDLRGSARARDVDFRVENAPQPFTDVTGLVTFQGQKIGFETVALNYGQVPGTVNGFIDLEDGYQLDGQVAAVPIANLLDTLEVNSPVPLQGLVQGDLQLRGPLRQPILSGTAQTRRTAQIDRVDFQAVETQFQLAGSLLTFSDIQATPVEGGQITGEGSIKFGEGDRGGLVFDLQGDNLPGDAIAQTYNVSTRNVTLGRVDVDAQIFGPISGLQTVLQWQAPNATYPGQGEVAIAGDQIRLQRTTLQVAGGTVEGQALLQEGQWQADVTGSGIQLARFSPQLQGTVGGDLRLSGRLDAFRPEAIRAEGRLNFPTGVASFSNALATLNQPLTAQVQWDGEKIRVLQAEADGLQADGLIFVDLPEGRAPSLTNLDLNVAATRYNLNRLPVSLPPALRLVGEADFTGQLTGAPADLTLAGEVQFNQLVVNTLPFEPGLDGNLRYALDEGLNLQVQGDRDQIALVTDANNRLQSFDIRRDQATALGRTVGEILQVQLANFPVGVLDVPPGGIANLGPLDGLANADLDINWDQRSVVGQVAIADPRLGYIEADQFTGNIRYADGVSVLTDGELRDGESQYLISGRFDSGPDPQFQAQVEIAQAQLQDVLTTLQFFELQDLGRGLQPPVYAEPDVLNAEAVGLSEATLLEQLRRFAEIQALLEQQIEQREAASILPPLADLTGRLTGEIAIAGSLQQGIQVDFDVEGQGWQWDSYDVNRVIASGTFEDGVLTLLPLRFEGNDDILLTFSGQVGGNEQSGQLRAENLPVEVLQELIELPVGLEGNLNATATLGGSLDNPQVVGELVLQEGAINRTPLQTAQGRFNYADARLNLATDLIAEEPNPLSLRASVPYSFPFMSVEPESDRVDIRVNVQDEGLALLNAFNRQVAWESGEGEVQLQVGGTLSRPTVQGLACLNGATLQAQALPEPLTDVTGQVRFSGDRIIVDQLQGQFSQGEVSAEGILPILYPLSLGGLTSPEPSDGAVCPDVSIAAAPEQPLTVDLNNIDLNLKGLYSGGVSGEVQVTGTALAPEISGDILLADGRIALPDTADGVTPGTPTAPSDSPLADLTAPPRFEDLVLTLGRNVQVTKQPLLAFVAEGDLTLNGTLDDLRPDGTIELKRGQVNLFTTRFRLASGYPQTAVFRPERGPDPILDVRLVTSVTEVSRAPIVESSPFVTSEIQDVPATSLGELQTVRIEARVEGPASELFNNIELSSSPARSQTEIVSLIGGGFAETLGRGDSALAIANLAGSTLLGNIQDLVGAAIGLSEFRLFPTATLGSENRTSTLGLGAEIGIDITSDLSASVVQILTDSSQPPQFNLRYRINDEFLLRGATNLDDEARVVLEYETRF